MSMDPTEGRALLKKESLVFGIGVTAIEIILKEALPKFKTSADRIFSDVRIVGPSASSLMYFRASACYHARAMINQ